MLPRWRSTGLLPLLLLGLFTVPAASSTFDGAPKILLHVGPTVPTTKNPLAGCVNPGPATCQQAVTSGGLAQPAVGPFYFVYLVGARGSKPNQAAIECGIDYQGGNWAGQMDGIGIDIFSWQVCANMDLESPANPLYGPAWPGPHSGDIVFFHTPANCQTGDVAPYGYFYLGAYSPDVLRIIPRPVDQLAKMANCQSSEMTLAPTDLGWVRFSANGDPGCNSCNGPCDADIIAVEPTTWSRIKLLTARH